jgi:two-component system sensor kinase FixL
MVISFTGASNDALFQTLIATAVDGIVVIDEFGVVQVYNAACQTLFGYTVEEVVGRNVKMLMPEPYRAEHDHYLQNYQRTCDKKIIGVGREVVGRRKDGTIFPMYLSVGEGSLHGKRIFVGIIHDLTSREDARRQMGVLQSELLHVARLSDMTQMVAALAHELNQPLAAVMNYVKAARRTISTWDGAQRHKTEELIDKAAEQTARAGKIIRHLRDFLEKRESVRTDEDINTVVRESIELAFAGAAHTNVDLKLDLMKDSPQVFIDKVQVQQVIINLIRNSAEAMLDSAERTLWVSTMRSVGGVLEIAVSDSGPGLSPEVSARLFQPFVTNKASGMGIGLSICHSIVEAHKGRIWATPREPTGVTFHFTLPASSAG